MGRHSDFFTKNFHKLRQAALFQVFDQNWIDPTPAKLKVLVVRLSPHRDVAESYTHSFLASEVLASGVDVGVDMAFLPVGSDRKIYDAHKVPWLTGIRSGLSPLEFDLILVSNSYTLEMVNLPILLQQAGIPLWASQRNEGDPLVLLGGANTLAAHALFKTNDQGVLDSYADGVFFGEAEGLVLSMVKSLFLALKEPRRERLEALRLAARESLWTPNWQGVIKKSVIPLDELPPGIPYPLLNSEGANRAKLPISYGCPYFCSFCLEGFEHKPYREITLEAIQERGRRLREVQGALNVDLFSFNFNTHSDIFPLLLSLNKQFDDVGFLSQRLDVLNNTPGLLEAEIAADKRSYTLGVEGISSYQRALFQKGLIDSDIMEILGRLLRSKIREIKLFYILSGYENGVDFFEFKTFLKSFQELRRNTNPGIRVIFSFGLLVRMPFTPMGYDRLFLTEEHWKPLIAEAKGAVEAHGCEFRLAFSWEEYLLTQVLAIQPDSQTLIEEMTNRGWMFDRSLPAEARNWILSELPLRGYTSEAWAKSRSVDSQWPLSFLNSGFEPDFMYKRYQDALEALAGRTKDLRSKVILENRETCLSSQCLGCQACQDVETKKALLNHGIRPSRTPAFAHALAEVVKAKTKPLSLTVTLPLPKSLCGAQADFLAAWVTRQVYGFSAYLGQRIVRVRELLFEEGGEDFTPVAWFGRGLFSFEFAQTEDPQGLQDAFAQAPEGWALLETSHKVSSYKWESFKGYELCLTLPQEFFPDADVKLAQWLEGAYLLHTLVKKEGWQEHQFSKRIKERRFLLESRIAKVEQNWVIEWTAGPRFKPGKLLAPIAQSGLWRRASLEIKGWE